MVRSCKNLGQLPGYSATIFWLFTTAYSVYSQLLSTSGGRLLLLQPEDAPGCGDGDIIIMGDH